MHAERNAISGPSMRGHEKQMDKPVGDVARDCYIQQLTAAVSFQRQSVLRAHRRRDADSHRHDV